MSTSSGIINEVQTEISELFVASVSLKNAARTGADCSEVLSAIHGHALRIVSLVEKGCGPPFSSSSSASEAATGTTSLPIPMPAPAKVQAQTNQQVAAKDAKSSSKRVLDGGVTGPAKHSVSNVSKESKEPIASGETIEGYLTESEFANLDIVPNTKRALAEVMRYRKMTVVQEEAIPVLLRGLDALVKARTGTGKTLGFLIPAINNLLLELPKTPRGSSRPMILAISPVSCAPVTVHFVNLIHLCCCSDARVESADRHRGVASVHLPSAASGHARRGHEHQQRQESALPRGYAGFHCGGYSRSPA